MRVQVPAGQEAAYAARYTAQTGVEYAEPNYWVLTERDDVQILSFAPRKTSPSTQAFTPTDPYFVNVPTTDPFAYNDPGRGLSYTNVPYPRGFYRIKAPDAWNAGYAGQGVMVSIVDEGTDLWGSSARSKAFLDILNYGTAKGTT